MKLLKKIAIVLLVAFVAIQFFRPSPNISHGNHTKLFISETNPPQDVKVLLEQTCYDCHSNHTNYPWYNNVAPISFWLADHIKEGKGHLNFSEWNSYDSKKKDHKLEEVEEMVGEGEMPLIEYTWTHEGANLTEEQRKEIVAWAQKTRLLYEADLQPE
mgnify:CR=1 FL=1